MGETVIVQKEEDGIAVLTLNQPERANALSKQLLSDFQTALEKLHTDRSVRAVIITGSGEKAFCAGADLKERHGMAAEEVKQAVKQIGTVIGEIERLPKPVIAAINGAALGGGLELALACDLRLAAKDAKLGLTETALAIIPGAGGTQRLPRLIGAGKAKELIYAAERLSGEQAERIGLVEYAVEKKDVMERSRQLAKKIAKNGPLALAQAKIAINSGLETDLATGLRIEELAYQALIPTEDRLEGLRAFKGKRAPNYEGK